MKLTVQVNKKLPFSFRATPFARRARSVPYWFRSSLGTSALPYRTVLY
jgi:hypothetical protein